MAKSLLLLFFSNIFMTFAWYGHLKSLKNSPLIVAILVSWGIAFFEYLIQVPANRIGFSHMTLFQLKISQEIITLLVFALFSVFYMKIPLTKNFLIASLLMVGAVFFIFQDQK